ncbi:HotDog domain-containing protein [Syncephalastrum racemosum]|uniref:HotDog domain-containing protein n=1 Tax=Syncephalastrum racemosum TaxID=13706 RepID=A0A1X2H140_SYNRA|nr:HotDog domain-containing protein [Syncephalastrum racemosum]
MDNSISMTNGRANKEADEICQLRYPRSLSFISRLIRGRIVPRPRHIHLLAMYHGWRILQAQQKHKSLLLRFGKQRSVGFMMTNQEYSYPQNARTRPDFLVRSRSYKGRLYHSMVAEQVTDVASNGVPKDQLATIMNGHGPQAELNMDPSAEIAADGSHEADLTPEQERLLNEQESLAIVQKLRQSPDWHEVVAYGHLSDSARAHSLSATTLRGDGKIALRPLKFFNHDKTDCIIIAHLGTNLCGHDGIIHGGLLATLLDEHLAYVTLPSLPNYTGFTANLSVDYRMPVRSNQWVVVRGKLDRVEGRKAYADAWIESVDGEHKMTEAKALYVSPRMDK